MTSQNDQIQALIAEIDGVLRKSNPRLPWVMSGDVVRQRRVLERVRNYLASVQPRGGAERSLSAQPRRAMLSGTPSPDPVAYPVSASPNNLNQQILQSVVQDLRTAVIHPLQADLESLRQQREELQAEVKQLQQQQASASFAQQQASYQQATAELLQVLMDRLQERLSQQVSQTLAGLATERPDWRGAIAPQSPENPTDLPLLTPQQRLEQLRAIASQSDQIISSLDSSMRVVFETLQSNLKSYHDSLSQGIENMHSMGQQGEVMFSALIKRLAEDLGRETSTYLNTRTETHSPEKSLPPVTGNPKSSASTFDPTPTASAMGIDEDDLDLLDLNSGDWELNAEEIDILLERDLLAETSPNLEDQPSPPSTEEEIDSAIQLLNSLNETPETESPNLPPSSNAASVTPESVELQDLYDALFGANALSPVLGEELEAQLDLANFRDPSEEPLTPDPPAVEPEESQPEIPESLESSETEPSEPSQEDVDSPPKLDEAMSSNVDEWVNTVEKDLFGEELEPEAEAQSLEVTGEISVEAIERWLFADTSQLASSSSQPKVRSVSQTSNLEPNEIEAQSIDEETLANFVELFGDESLEDEEIAIAQDEGFSVEITGTLSNELIPKIDSQSMRDREDIFIPASPEESLLPTEDEALDQTKWSFWPDSTTLEQLQSDLSSLEAADTSSSRKSVPSNLNTDLNRTSYNNSQANSSNRQSLLSKQPEMLSSSSDEITLDEFVSDIEETPEAIAPTDELGFDEFISNIEETPESELSADEITLDEFVSDIEETPEAIAPTDELGFDEFISNIEETPESELSADEITFDGFVSDIEETPESELSTDEFVSDIEETPASELSVDEVTFDGFASDREETPESELATDEITLDEFVSDIEETPEAIAPTDELGFDEFISDTEETSEPELFIDELTFDGFVSDIEETPESGLSTDEVTLDELADEIGETATPESDTEEEALTGFDLSSLDRFFAEPPFNSNPQTEPRANPLPELSEVDTQNLTIGNAFGSFFREAKTPEIEAEDTDTLSSESSVEDSIDSEKKKTFDA